MHKFLLKRNELISNYKYHYNKNFRKIICSFDILDKFIRRWARSWIYKKKLYLYTYNTITLYSLKNNKKRKKYKYSLLECRIQRNIVFFCMCKHLSKYIFHTYLPISLSMNVRQIFRIWTGKQ